MFFFPQRRPNYIYIIIIGSFSAKTKPKDDNLASTWCGVLSRATRFWSFSFCFLIYFSLFYYFNCVIFRVHAKDVLLQDLLMSFFILKYYWLEIIIILTEYFWMCRIYLFQASDWILKEKKLKLFSQQLVSNHLLEKDLSSHTFKSTVSIMIISNQRYLRIKKIINKSCSNMLNYWLLPSTWFYSQFIYSYDTLQQIIKHN